MARTAPVTPAGAAAVRDPYCVVRPYSNHQVVARPPVLSVPVTAAVVTETPAVGPVTAVGGPPTRIDESPAAAVPAPDETTRR